MRDESKPVTTIECKRHGQQPGIPMVGSGPVCIACYASKNPPKLEATHENGLEIHVGLKEVDHKEAVEALKAVRKRLDEYANGGVADDALNEIDGLVSEVIPTEPPSVYALANCLHECAQQVRSGVGGAAIAHTIETCTDALLGAVTLPSRSELTKVVEYALDKPEMPPLDEFGDYRKVVKSVVNCLMHWKGWKSE